MENISELLNKENKNFSSRIELIKKESIIINNNHNIIYFKEKENQINQSNKILQIFSKKNEKINYLYQEIDLNETKNKICCNIYEICVSYCLNQKKIFIPKQFRQKKFQHLKKNNFLLCQLICRTNSNSVKFENSYYHHEYKYCIG